MAGQVVNRHLKQTMVNEHNLYRYLGEKIKRLRLKNNLTQDDLAEKSGLTRSQIMNIEEGYCKTSIHTLYDICEVIGAEPTQFLPTLEALSRFHYGG